MGFCLARSILQQQPSSLRFSSRLVTTLFPALSCPASAFLHYTVLPELSTAFARPFIYTLDRFAAARSLNLRSHRFLLHSETAAMVFITSDLFGPANIHTQPHNYWSTMTDTQQHAVGLGKRKRLQDGNGDVPHTSRGPCSQHPAAFDHNNERSYDLYAASSGYQTAEHRPIKQIKRINPKLALVKSTSHLMDTETSTSLPVGFAHGQVQPHVVTDLRACHACKSAPKRRKDLENYMDCKRCDGRTCYICARQCLGGCGKKICKECIAEVGQEGDSWCLDCFQRQINI